MKALQNNSEWISQVYEQESGEGNWKVADVSFKQSRIPQSIVSATTSSATILSPDGGYSSTQDITVGNSTDGEVAITAPLTNDPYSAFSGTWNPVSSTTNYWDSANSGISNNNQLISALMTPDGTILYRKYSSGDTWYKFTLATPFRPLTSGNTFETSFSLTSQVGLTLPQSQKASYAAGGNYVLIFGYRQSVALIKLGTPYLLETAVSTQVVDLESKYRAHVATWNSNYDYQMFSGMKLSSDGTKGILSVKGAGSTAGNANLSGCIFADFTLTTPFDLSTFTFGNTSAFNENSGQTGHFIHYTEITEDGKYIHFLNTNYQYGYGYFRTIALADAWDVSGSYSRTMSEYSQNFVDETAVYSANQTGSLIFDDAGKNITGFGINGEQTLVSAWSGKFLPTTELDITSASLTVAPTSVLEDNTVPTVSIQAQTRADFEKEGVAFSVSGESTTTSLVLSPATQFDGTVSLETGDSLVIDGNTVLTGTVTRDDDYWSTITLQNGGTNSTAPSYDYIKRKLDGYASAGGMYLTQLVTLEGVGYTSTSASGPRGGAVFSHDGRYFFLNAPQNTQNWSGGFTTQNYSWIVKYSLSTPWDLSTATAVEGINTTLDVFTGPASTNYECQDFSFNNDGTKYYQVNSYSSGYISYINEVNLTTPYDLNTATAVGQYRFSNYGFPSGKMVYSARFDRTGSFLTVGWTDSAANLGTGYCDVGIARLTTPFDLSTMGNNETWSTSGYHFCPHPIGSSETGYYILTSPNGSTTSDHDRTLAIMTGNLNAKTSATTNYLDFGTDVNGFTRQFQPISCIRVQDNDTKHIIFYSSTRKVAVIQGPFSSSDEAYTVDVTSAGLSSLPKEVRFSANATYDSLGTATLQSSTTTERTYAYTSKSLDAEALRFKIDGDEGDEIKQVNVDLFTS